MNGNAFPMKRRGHREAACLGKAALKTHALQTLRDCRASPNRAKRLECVRFIGAFRPARDGQRFMVPMHGIKVVGLSMNHGLLARTSISLLQFDYLQPPSRPMRSL